WHEGTPGKLYTLAGLYVLAFFDLTTMQHERYLFPAIALFLMASFYERGQVLFFRVCHLSSFTNMFLTALLAFTSRGRGTSFLGPGAAAVWAFWLSGAVVVSNLLILAYGLLLQRRRVRTPAPATVAPARRG